MFKKLQTNLTIKSGKVIANGISDTIRAHFQFQFPGSSHYNPKKVNPRNISRLNEGVVDVDVPGVSRAYQDIDIRPRNKQYLTIPMHREAFGKKASDFNDLFVVRKKDGKGFLAKNNGGNLTMMFFLSKHVHQRMNPRIMPTDNELASVSMSRLSNLVRDIVGKELDNI